jgi:hypothetical protein
MDTWYRVYKSINIIRSLRVKLTKRRFKNGFFINRNQRKRIIVRYILKKIKYWKKKKFWKIFCKIYG